MSRPKNDFYGYIRMRIMKYPKIKEEPGIVPYLQWNAIEAALAELQQDPKNADKLKAIDLVLLKKTHTIDGAAWELNYSWRTIQIWISDFINDVGTRAGF